LRTLHALLQDDTIVADIDPDILESAADRILEDLPEFMAPQADRLAAALALTLVESKVGSRDRYEEQYGNTEAAVSYRPAPSPA
jgi:hypothetical protein